VKRLFSVVLILAFGVSLLFIAPTPVVEAQAGVCSQSATISLASGSAAVLVSGSAGGSTFVCGFVVSADTLATTVQFSRGTGTACGTGGVNLGGAMRLCDECNISFVHYLPIWQVTPNYATPNVTPDFCITTATGAVTGFLIYGRSQ
jgi:hypothetical protein